MTRLHVVTDPPSCSGLAWGSLPGAEWPDWQHYNTRKVVAIAAALSRPGHFAPDVWEAWHALAVGIAGR